MGVDEGADVALERLGGTMDAAPDLLVGDQGEEAFDLVDPGGRGGGEMNMKSRTSGKPSADRRGLVGAVVVEDEVQVHIRWCSPVDRAQERRNS